MKHGEDCSVTVKWTLFQPQVSEVFNHYHTSSHPLDCANSYSSKWYNVSDLQMSANGCAESSYEVALFRKEEK